VFPLGIVGDVDVWRGHGCYSYEAVATCTTRTFNVSRSAYLDYVKNQELGGNTAGLVQKMVETREHWRELRQSLAKKNPEINIPITVS
jgi:hypothetical protein